MLQSTCLVSATNKPRQDGNQEGGGEGDPPARPPLSVNMPARWQQQTITNRARHVDYIGVHSSRSPVGLAPLPLPLRATQRRSHMQLAAAITAQALRVLDNRGYIPAWLCGTSVSPHGMQTQIPFFLFEMSGVLFLGVSRIPSPAKPSISPMRRKKKTKSNKEKKEVMPAAENTRHDTPPNHQTISNFLCSQLSASPAARLAIRCLHASTPCMEAPYASPAQPCRG